MVILWLFVFPCQRCICNSNPNKTSWIHRWEWYIVFFPKLTFFLLSGVMCLKCICELNEDWFSFRFQENEFKRTLLGGVNSWIRYVKLVKVFFFSDVGVLSSYFIAISSEATVFLLLGFFWSFKSYWATKFFTWPFCKIKIGTSLRAWTAFCVYKENGNQRKGGNCKQ